MISLGVLLCINIIKIKLNTAMIIFLINIAFVILWVFVNTIRKSIKNENWTLEADEQLDKDLDTMDDLEEGRVKTQDGCGSIKSS